MSDPGVVIIEMIPGGVGERLKPPVLKTGVHFVDREFESRPLRQSRGRFAGPEHPASKLQEINHGKMAAAVFNRLLYRRLDFALRFADLFCRSSSRKRSAIANSKPW